MPQQPNRKVWVVYIMVSDRVRQKIMTKHGITMDQVNEACLFGRHTKAGWREDGYLLVEGVDAAGHVITAVLRPIINSDGGFACVTARMKR